MAIQDQFDHLITTQGGHPAEDVAPCVLREIDGIDPYAPGALSAIHADPLRTAFADLSAVFGLDAVGCATGALSDALIAQQDRNLGNLRFDYSAGTYGLIDHGYAFARDPWNMSPLVQARACHGDVRLDH